MGNLRIIMKHLMLSERKTKMMWILFQKFQSLCRGDWVFLLSPRIKNQDDFGSSKGYRLCYKSEHFKDFEHVCSCLCLNYVLVKLLL